MGWRLHSTQTWLKSLFDLRSPHSFANHDSFRENGCQPSKTRCPENPGLRRASWLVHLYSHRGSHLKENMQCESCDQQWRLWVCSWSCIPALGFCYRGRTGTALLLLRGPKLLRLPLHQPETAYLFPAQCYRHLLWNQELLLCARHSPQPFRVVRSWGTHSLGVLGLNFYFPTVIHDISPLKHAKQTPSTGVKEDRKNNLTTQWILYLKKTS